MKEEKLIIKPRRYGSETTVISLRLPKEMIKIIEEVASSTGRTRNEIMLLSLEFALENLDLDEK